VNGVKRKIRGKEFVRDLRNGMDDGQFMEKYDLSAEQLRKLFRKLVDSGIIDEMELYTRTSLSDSTSTKTVRESRGAIQRLDRKHLLRKTVGELLPQRLKRRTA